ncbi:MAG: homoserine dehydrogenase [Actinobacteria bacterium]|jgi:homoserine dehydrogenase|nr:homoserine dehydrogenase [Actinomycetota bacterium]NCV42041.1 homoserine dehydrogenase [Actinomycetota bacterium]NCV82069.1 homoserine dehydrogenase [Actinomycetota bacterium]NCW42559.1 homoserine dehydrogenase [Actinomycetota bacterium]NCW71430.1 homoserine dehydrogenase [Actinomycetota bacterium]
MSAELKTISIGMLGCGVVGSQVARLLQSDEQELSERSGALLVLKKIGVRSNAARDGINPSMLTTDLNSIVNDPEINIVIEVMGGIEPARTLILEAIKNKKSVITANKALLATHGHELFNAADAAKVDLYYEAAVAGAIPIIRSMRESLAGDQITRVMGIVNGTTNFILTKMHEEGRDFNDVLKEAQSLGYAEADPTADIEGHDAAAKAALLASLAFHSTVTIDEVYCEGITGISIDDVNAAKAMGSVIKLLAIAELTVKDEISVRVHPVMLPSSHPLASVRNAFNAVYVESEAAGQLMFYGRGAGGAPTASAILGDLVAVTRHRAYSTVGYGESDYADLDIAPVGDVKSQFFIRLHVADKSGVLASIAQVFASENISIQTVRQAGLGSDAELVVVTHAASESSLKSCIKKLTDMDIVSTVESVIRVDGVVA